MMAAEVAFAIVAFFTIGLVLKIVVMVALAARREAQRYSVAGYRRELRYSPPGGLVRGAGLLTASGYSIQC
jgi:hypothetical protein